MEPLMHVPLCPDKVIVAGLAGSYAPYLFSALAGRHDGDVICLRSRAVNIQHSSMQSAYSTSNLPPLSGAGSGTDNPSSRISPPSFASGHRGEQSHIRQKKRRYRM